jgi:EpsI family protein
MNDERWIARATAARARLSRREALIGGTFLAAAAAGLALKPRTAENLLGDAKLDQLVPQRIDGWQFNTASGLVLPPADQLRDSIYSQLLTRTYVRDGAAPVMLLIAYSGAQDGTIQIHRPEVCYPASGFKLLRNDPHQVPLGTGAGAGLPSRAIVATTETRREQLIYWTRLGDHFPTRWIEQRLAVTAENFAGIVPDGVLVRISTVGDGDQFALLDGFARELVASVGRRARQVLLGPSAG